MTLTFPEELTLTSPRSPCIIAAPDVSNLSVDNTPLSCASPVSPNVIFDVTEENDISFGIAITEWEFIGIRLTDGLYEDANSTYLKSYNPDWQLKSNIAYILHQADSMATHIEYDMWKRSLVEKKAEVVQRVENIKKAANNPTQERTKDLFNELFGDKK